MSKKNKYSFKKNERLCSKKLIQKLINQGNQFRTFPFFVRFYTIEQANSKAQILFSVPKKKFKKAVDRNKIKRLCKEAYRLNKSKLYNCLDLKNTKIIISVSYYDSNLANFELVSKKINEIIDKICKKI
jgi:ribonuclease P protein component